MKKCFVRTSWGGLIVFSWVFLFFVGTAPLATAAQPQQARVSQVIQDVRLLEAHTAPRPAVVNDKLILGTAVRTGVESRVELTFTDLTITRLGANTIFSFSRGARELELTSGAILLEVPPNKAPVRVNTSAVTVAITGGTALFATGPPTKFMVLEGIGTFYPAGHPEKAVAVHGGEMVMMTADGQITKPEKFDVRLVIETSRLILDFPPLTNLPLILAVVNQQIAEQQMAGTTSQTLAKNLVDVIDVTDQNANANPVVLASTSTMSPPPPPPPPTPSKFGTPTVITSPVPYVITSGTTITTDPSITTNGVTDYGKIYRGPAIDGAFSLWAFGSTSAIDTALDFDTHFNNAGHFPGAVVKFTSLELAGNPTIDLSNGGVTNLALISVGDITSGLPGGTLTFTGLDALLLASQSGSINLGSEITFQDIPTLFFYARGTNGVLTLASPIVGTTDLFLYAGRNITFNAGTDLILGGQFSARSVGGNISVSESGNISIGGSLSATTDVIADTVTGGNMTFATGGFLSTSNFDAETTVEQGVTLNNGANITLNIGGDLTIVGGDLLLTVGDSNGGHIGTGGNIFVTTGAAGDFTANSILAFVDNHNGGTIDSGANITFDIGGALTTTADATFGITNRNDGSGGGTIGSNVLVSLIAESVSVGGFFDTFISTNGGGHIIGNAINTVSATGDLTAQQGILVEIADTIFGGTGNFTGGRIDRDAIVTLSAQNITTPSTNSGIPGTDLMAIEASIYPNASGTVGGDAIVDVSASQNISAPGSVLFWIANGNYLDLGGGTIGGDARVNVSAASLSTGDLFAQILNYGGASIGGDAAINITADTLSVGGNLDSRIDNSSSGTIGGNATIDMNVSGSATVTTNATIQIFGSDGAAASAILINGGNYNVGGTFLSYIDGNGSITFSNASAHADVLKAGVFGANGTLNIGGGTLSADTTLKLYAPGSNGQLNFLSNVTLDGNSEKILAANSVTIFDNIVVTVGGNAPADVYTNNANYSERWGGNGSTTGTFAGAGANRPQPLSEAPPFGAPTPGNPTNGKRTRTVMNIKNSGQLLSLLDGAVPGPDGRLRVPRHNRRNAGNPDRLNVSRMTKADRDVADIRRMRDRGVINNRLGSGTRAF